MWWASPASSSPPQVNVSRSPGRQLDDVLAQRADPQLRPGQVLQDRDRAPDPPGGVAHAADRLGVLLERAVGVVQARDVHARLDHAHERLRLARGGTDRRDDLRAAHQLDRIDGEPPDPYHRDVLGPSRPCPVSAAALA